MTNQMFLVGHPTRPQARPHSCPQVTRDIVLLDSSRHVLLLSCSWSLPEDDCKTYHRSGHLASIHDWAEKHAVVSYILAEQPKVGNVWIGLFDSNKVSTWKPQQEGRGRLWEGILFPTGREGTPVPVLTGECWFCCSENRPSWLSPPVLPSGCHACLDQCYPLTTEDETKEGPLS